jgi:hypothetical protein
MRVAQSLYTNIFLKDLIQSFLKYVTASFCIVFCLCEYAQAQEQSSPRMPNSTRLSQSVQRPRAGFDTNTTSSANTEDMVQDSTLSQQEQEIIAVLRAQPRRWFVGIALINGVPTGEFKQVMDSIGKSSFWGVQLHGGYAFDPVPVAVGMNIDFLFAGSTTRTWSRGNFPFRTFDTVTVTNLVLPISLFARIQPTLTPIPGWSVRPYFEGFAGLTVLTSTISFVTDTPTSRQSSSDNDASAPLHYGLSSGIQIQLAESITLPTSRTLVMLDIRGRYVAGASTNYRMVSWNDAINAPQSTYLRSATGMTIWSAGITVYF